MRTDTQKFIDALADFKKASAKLSQAWTEAPSTVQEAPNLLYPFKQSFDDLNVEIAEWVDDSINRVKYFENLTKFTKP